MNIFLDPSQRDDNGIIRFYNVSATIIDFHGKKTYSVIVSKDEVKVLKENEVSIQFLFDGKKRKTFKKKDLIKNETRNIVGGNGFGIGSNLSCSKEEIEETIVHCINDMWKKIDLMKDDVPDWVHDFRDKEPQMHRGDTGT